MPEPLDTECYKYDCYQRAVTVEQDDIENFPNALCEEHARRPDKLGTFEKPTQIP